MYMSNAYIEVICIPKMYTGKNKIFDYTPNERFIMVMLGGKRFLV